VSLPRQVLAGSTYLVTRRCSERRFFLRPSKLTNDLLLYCLAVAAQRTGVLVHAFCALSDHYHLVVTDPSARLPEFMQWLDGTLARALNASYGHFEQFFAPGSYSAVRLESPETTCQKIIYTLANPVASGLVKWAHHWPGLWSAPRQIGGEARLALRPLLFFDRDGELPERCALPLLRPPGFDDLSDAEFGTLIDRRLAQHQREIHRDFEAQGRSFLGRRAVLDQKPTDSPKTREPRFERNPRIAEKNKWLRIDAIARLQAFRRDYRAAWLAFKAGARRRVVFPAGTYLLHVQLGLPVADSA
jgi:REP element-mobilizing transposase RayT